MIFWALTLAAIGIGLAVVQAQSINRRLNRDLRTIAQLAAQQAVSVFMGTESEIMRDAALSLCEAPRPCEESRLNLPNWLDAVFAWNGTSVCLIRPPSATIGLRTPNSNPILSGLQEYDSQKALTAVQSEGAHEWLHQFPGEGMLSIVDVDLASHRAMLLKSGMKLSQSMRISYATDTALVLRADIPCDSHVGGIQSIFGIVPQPALSKDLLEPIVDGYDGIEVVASSSINRSYWSESLPEPFGAWAIQPIPSALAARERAILYPTYAYVALTLLALAALLTAAWFLMRLVRREVALAELKSNFVADVSHEIKTPLAMIQLFAETLQSGRVSSDEKRQEYYSIISRESNRLTELINNILDFARIEAGRRQYRLQPTDLAAVVRETYETYRSELERNGFDHRLTVATPLPPVNADREAVAQILVNLISNAIKYSADEKVIAIDLRTDTRRGRHGVVLSVEDHGIGIRPEDRARIFEGFFRAEDGRVLRQGGTGLGLSLVKAIVDAHEGTLDVEPRLFKGTAFRVFLPSASESNV